MAISRAREWVHSNTPSKSNLTFEKMYKNLSFTYEQARGMEQMLYEEYGKVAKTKGFKLQNMIRPIGLKNKNYFKYIDEVVKIIGKIK